MNESFPEDFKEYTAYVETKLNGQAHSMTIEETVHEYREYQRELADLRAKVQEALDSSAKGLSKPLDVEALKGIVRERLASEGIVD